MTENREILVREIQRLQKSQRRWRAIALAAILLSFVMLLPFTVAFREVIGHYEWPKLTNEDDSIDPEPLLNFERNEPP